VEEEGDHRDSRHCLTGNGEPSSGIDPSVMCWQGRNPPSTRPNVEVKSGDSRTTSTANLDLSSRLPTPDSLESTCSVAPSGRRYA
jgi:hypothetical protein